MSSGESADVNGEIRNDPEPRKPRPLIWLSGLGRTYGYENQPGNHAPPGYQLDEYPYASTAQGGMAGPAEGKPVPARENSVQVGGFECVLSFKTEIGAWGGIYYCTCSHLKSINGDVFCGNIRII